MSAVLRVWALTCSWLSLAALDASGFAMAQTGHEHVGEAATSSPNPPRPREFPDGNAWTIDGGLAWGVGFSESVVFVPHGFVHDRASVPRVLWSLASYTRAAVVHDWLYWAQPCSRLQADNLLMIAMKEAGVPWVQRQLVYRSVRLQGQSVWNRNSQERAIGLPRINPYGYVPDNMTWPQLREKMFREGVRDLRYVAPAGYCRYGDSRNVPEPSAASVGGREGVADGHLRGH